MRSRSARLALFRFALAGAAATVALSGTALQAAEPVIALVGGMKTGFPVGEHDFPDGVLKLERLIKASPDFARIKARVKVFPVGFPKDLGEIADADVVVLYSGTHREGGRMVHPFEDPAVHAAMDKLMARGAGLVALHQSFTVADRKNNASLREWLGGERVSPADLTIENAPLSVAARGHPIANGVGAFHYVDEFYPTVEFAGAGNLPILSGRIHVQQRGSQPLFEEPAKARTVAWAHERAGGGRAFAYSGAHYLAAFDQPQARKLILNAILWAAKEEVPSAGAESAVPVLPPLGQPLAVQPHRVVLPLAEAQSLPQPWGNLQWFVSRELGNSTVMTVGQATIRPGQANPPHWHPNCDEVLHVIHGHIMHRVGDKEYEMHTGDTVSIPQGTIHNARNIGTEDAILAVSFNSADRVAIGEN